MLRPVLLAVTVTSCLVLASTRLTTEACAENAAGQSGYGVDNVRNLSDLRACRVDDVEKFQLGGSRAGSSSRLTTNSSSFDNNNEVETASDDVVTANIERPSDTDEQQTAETAEVLVSPPSSSDEEQTASEGSGDDDKQEQIAALGIDGPGPDDDDPAASEENEETTSSDNNDENSNDSDTADGSSDADENKEATAEAEPEVDPKLPSDPVVLAMLKKLESGRKTKQNDLIAEFYTKPDRLPFWVTDTGLSPQGKEVASEIAKAEEYGLRASDFRLPTFNSKSPSVEEQASAELTMMRAILTYARHSRGGRIKRSLVRSQLEKAPKLPNTKAVMFAVTSSEDPAAYLRSQHPKHPQFAMLREKLKELRYGKDGGKGPKIPAGPVLKLGVNHEHVSLLRKRLDMAETSGDINEFDDDVLAAVKKFQSRKGIATDGVVGSGTRRVLNGVKSGGALVNKVLANMERWRWLPRNMEGDAGMYIWANLPEFHVRVMRGDEAVFSNRGIIGLTTHKTPVFSDELEWIEIHPTWYVPNSIKVADILPSLRRPTSTVMSRYNLKLNCGAAGSDPKSIDWTKQNITACEITQPPGPKSVLGDFKFKFPNKHSVYMHDTHKPELFNQTTRAFSHGCIRVKSPRRMAEVILEHQNVMSKEKLGRVLKGPQKLYTAKLPNHVPVHFTYFTTSFDDKGKFKSHADIYGHDRALLAALRGSSAAPEAAVARSEATKPKQQAKKKKPKKKKTAQQETDWWDDIFSN